MSPLTKVDHGTNRGRGQAPSLLYTGLASAVMLSTFATLSVNSAKHLCASRDMPFAVLRVTQFGNLS